MSYLDLLFLSKRYWAASPLPEREVSSHPPLLPAAAGGKKENWKALIPMRETANSRSEQSNVLIRSHFEELKKQNKDATYYLAHIGGSCDTL
jgi:hypothetical protein